MVASIKPHRDEVGLADGLMLIDGHWVAALGGETWTHRHPATGEDVASFPVAAPGDVDLAVRAARRAFDDGPWPKARRAARTARSTSPGAATGNEATSSPVAGWR